MFTSADILFFSAIGWVSIKKTLRSLSGIMDNAVKLKHIKQNPVPLVRMTKEMSEDEQIQEEKVDFLTLAEVKKMIDNVDVLKYKVLFLMATIHWTPRGGNSGAEMVGLLAGGPPGPCVKNFNHVCFYTPKSNRSRQSVNLIPKIVTYLRRW